MKRDQEDRPPVMVVWEWNMTTFSRKDVELFVLGLCRDAEDRAAALRTLRDPGALIHVLTENRSDGSEALAGVIVGARRGRVCRIASMSMAETDFLERNGDVLLRAMIASLADEARDCGCRWLVMTTSEDDTFLHLVMRDLGAKATFVRCPSDRDEYRFKLDLRDRKITAVRASGRTHDDRAT